ncbi:MAG: isochorismatase family protein [Psychromonas sp.]|nr:isochorismatase family protein [Psychromonas sp.]
MLINGSLLAGMQQVISNLGVLVIDESGYNKKIHEGIMLPDDLKRSNFTPIKDITACQQKVILLARAYQCPIIFIQFDTSFPVGTYCYNDALGNYKWATKISIRALLPPDTIVINKHNPNAFVGTDLVNQLNSEYKGVGVKNLVVMGWQSNICVMETIGLRAKNCEKFIRGSGALQHKFIVLTCQDVLNGPTACWANLSKQIKFHTYL